MQVCKSNNSSINFGWNKTTHLEMTMLALRDLKISNIKKRQFARYSQMPDFARSELGYRYNTHFYFPNSNKKSFGSDVEKNNAYFQYKEHLMTALQSDDSDVFMKHAGYALHYLQDVTVPLHTEKGGIFHKILKFGVHYSFERKTKYGTLSNMEKLIKNHKFQKINFTTLLDLFKDTAEFSQAPHLKISMFNKKKWYSIQQECFDMGVNTTREFFEKLLSVKNNVI